MTNKMKDFKDLKKGDKLYSLTYSYDYKKDKSVREFETFTIKKKLAKCVSLYGGYSWNVSESDYGIKYFPTKTDCYKQALKRHENRFEDIEQEYRDFKKEIKYLKKKVKENEEIKTSCR